MLMFSLLGVCALLGAKLLLFMKILWSKDCTGISGKTQILYAIIFAARYVDILTAFYTQSFNVSLTRVTFIVLGYCNVLSIYFFYSRSYQSQHDKFRIELLIFPCIVLSLLANYGLDVVEVFWAFSVYLESVAILPQIYHASRVGRTENIVYYYISILSLSKIFYLMSGIYEFYMNDRFDRISLAAGIVQLMFYCDFFLRDVPVKSDRDEEGEIESGVDKFAGGAVTMTKEQEAALSALNNSNYLRQQQQVDDEAHNNLREIVLTPASLGNDDKATLPESAQEETNKETNNPSTVRV